MRKEVTNPPHHRRRDVLHHIGPRPRGPHDGNEPEHRGGHGHEFRPDTLGGPLHDGRPQVGKGAQAPLLSGLFVGQIQVEEHEDAGFGIHPEQGDEPHPDADAHVVAEQIEEPDGPHRRKGNRQQDDGRLHQGAGAEIEQQDDQQERHGHHHRQALPDPLHRLVLPAPG